MRIFRAGSKELGAALASLLALAGCNEFNAKLAERIVDDAGDGDGGDAGEAGPGDAATRSDSGLLLQELADRCSSVSSLPVIEGSAEEFEFNAKGLTSDTQESTQCGIASDVARGSDAYFAIEAKEGERWHMHLQASPQQDMAVSVSRSCDERQCTSAADICPGGQSEHLTFVPDQDGTYVVSVEGIDDGFDGVLRLLTIRPVCGDGTAEHSEVCDDGNRKAGDGCDRWCRAELEQGDQEVEPNDDPAGANVLMAPLADGIRARGDIGTGGTCQPDYYLLNVDSAQQLDIAILQPNGDTCDAAPRMELAVFASDGSELRAESAPLFKQTKEVACPTLEGVNLSEGAYFLRLRTLSSEPTRFDYRLSVAPSTP